MSARMSKLYPDPALTGLGAALDTGRSLPQYGAARAPPVAASPSLGYGMVATDAVDHGVVQLDPTMSSGHDITWASARHCDRGLCYR